MQKVTDILFFIVTSRKKRRIREDTETVLKKKAQESDIPSKIIKENSYIFGDYLFIMFS